MFRKTIAAGAVAGVMALAIGVVTSAAHADTRTESAGDAGTVTFSVEGGVIAFVSADPADGWDFTVEREDGRHLDVRFTDVFGAEVEFEAEIEGGVVALGGDDETSTTLGTTSTSAASSSSTTGESTATTIDDDHDDDDDDVTSTTIDDEGEDDEIGDDRDDDDGDLPFVPQQLTFLAGEAGSVDVLVVGDEIVFAGVTLQPGWEFELDHSGGSHVEVEFSHEDGRTLEFRVDADLRVRIEAES